METKSFEDLCSTASGHLRELDRAVRRLTANWCPAHMHAVHELVRELTTECIPAIAEHDPLIAKTIYDQVRERLAELKRDRRGAAGGVSPGRLATVGR